MDACASSPCLNDGECRNLVSSYACTCIAGYRGDTCQVDVDECASQPCAFGSTCIQEDYGFGYKCMSMDEARDDEGPRHRLRRAAKCTSTSCQNGGTCALERGADAVCYCAIGYSGVKCEKKELSVASIARFWGETAYSHDSKHLDNCVQMESDFKLAHDVSCLHLGISTGTCPHVNNQMIKKGVDGAEYGTAHVCGKNRARVVLQNPNKTSSPPIVFLSTPPVSTPNGKDHVETAARVTRLPVQPCPKKSVLNPCKPGSTGPDCKTECKTSGFWEFEFELQHPNTCALQGCSVVSWMVLPQGSFPDYQAGLLKIDINGEWTNLDFNPAFVSGPPAVITQVQTTVDASPVDTRIEGVTASRCLVLMESMTPSTKFVHSTEIIGWLAVRSGTGSFLAGPDSQLAFSAGITPMSSKAQSTPISVNFNYKFSTVPAVFATISAPGTSADVPARAFTGLSMVSDHAAVLIAEGENDCSTSQAPKALPQAISYFALGGLYTAPDLSDLVAYYQKTLTTTVNCTVVSANLNKTLENGCKLGVENEHCQECASSPCQNGGKCVELRSRYGCTCVSGFAGGNCDVVVDTCAMFPCQHGGTCSKSASKPFVCTCAKGWKGTTCGTDKDECISTPCAHNGKCVHGIDTYACNCQSGFGGMNCKDTVSACEKAPCGAVSTTDSKGNIIADHPVKKCVATGTKPYYQCQCSSGWKSGAAGKCEINMQECASKPCMNGGACSDKVSGFSCACLTGFVGNRCETDVDECA